MRRFAANRIYDAPDHWYRNGVVEIDEKTFLVNSLFSLDEVVLETRSTPFYNGIILPFCPQINECGVDVDLQQLLQTQFEVHPWSLLVGQKAELWLLQAKSLLSENKICIGYRLLKLI